MNLRSLRLLLFLPLMSLVDAAERDHPGVACFKPASDFFANEFWVKVGQSKCLKCHKAGADAEDSELILWEPTRDGFLDHNRAAFEKIVVAADVGRARVLRKVVGELEHGGEDVLKMGSTRYRILEEFVRRVNGGAPGTAVALASDTVPFFDGVEMLDDRRLLRRLTLSLVARLPTADEDAALERGGLVALDPILDQLMDEEAFYERLAEGFNDIFLTTGIDDVAENVLSYEHFDKTRHWYQSWDFSGIEDERKRKEAGWELARHYRESMQREPMEMVKHIVREGRPFTEIITADYIMVSPYTSRGYGIYEENEGRFKDIDDRFEYIPVKLEALTGRSEKTNQESATGFYPHAGILSTFQYLKRYPTTETNRNRLRVRMYFQHFLGVDLMQLAPRVNDAAAITAKYEVPTMEAADCVICHKIMDPVAGLFQDYYALDGKGVHKLREEGWFEDMFSPGHDGEALPDEERWRAMQWLGERTVEDPRFAVAMVEHVWYILCGRRALLPPEDIDHPLYPARQRAYAEQRQEIEAVARGFATDNFNLKNVFKKLAVSEFYRASGLASAAASPARRAELDDLGLVRLLSPEQLERKLKAIFGKGWGRLDEKFKILYGGIDAKEVTERIADPSGAMGAIQRMMANQIACRNVVLDFSRKPADRRLFPAIEVDEQGEAPVRVAMVHLHKLVLGLADPLEIDRSCALFHGIIGEAKQRGNFESVDIYSCRVERETRVEDPHYTLRAWRAVVTYLLRQHQFLYE